MQCHERDWHNADSLCHMEGVAVIRGSGLWIDRDVADFYGFRYKEIDHARRLVFVADIYLPCGFREMIAVEEVAS